MNMKQLVRSAAIVAAAIATTTVVSQAQCRSIVSPIGTNLTCIALATKTVTPVPVQNPRDPNNDRNDNLNGLNGANDPVALPVTFSSSGSGTFTALASPIGTPCTLYLSPSSISLTGSSPLGTITTSLSATAQTSSIVSNQTNAEFPATGNAYFNVSVTISSQPGKTFTSSTAVQLQNTNLTSFNPHVNQTYSQVGNVTLNDANGVPSYTISGLSVTLN